MRFLFVGLGGVGQRHLRNLIKHTSSEDEIYAFRVRKEQAVISDKLQIVESESLEEKYKIKTFNSLSDAFGIQPDAVFICNPTSMHIEIMLESAERGIPFFVEKPVSHNMENVDRLLRLCKENDVITFVGYQQRNNPCLIKTKQLIDDGKLGRLISIDAEVGERVTNWHKYEDYRRMYACRSDMGGGVVLSQIHELDYLYWFLGMPQTIYAIGGKLSDLEIDVEDSVDILMKYCIADSMVNVHVHEDYIQYPPSRKCKIVGTKGRIEIDLINLVFKYYDVSGELIIDEKYDMERNVMFEKEMIEFLNCIKNGSKTSLPIDIGINSLRIALAIKESIIKEKQIVL